jgi:hypothetical protein
MSSTLYADCHSSPPLHTPPSSSWQNPKEWPVQFMRVDWVGHAVATRSRELSVSTISVGCWEREEGLTCHSLFEQCRDDEDLHSLAGLI